MTFEKNIVKKPWGYEYLVYENENIGMWLLYISNNNQTSMHCHSEKTTGLVVLDGQVEITFLSDSKIPASTGRGLPQWAAGSDRRFS